MPILSLANKTMSRSLLVGNAYYQPTAFESIATTTTNASSFTFSSIPSTYQHLQLRINWIDTYGYQGLLMRFNGDTGNNYYFHTLYGTGASRNATASSGSSISIFDYGYNGSSPTAPNVMIVDILDYNSSTKNKTTRTFFGQADGTTNTELGLMSGAWFNTNAINSINIRSSGLSWSTGTSIALYGIKGA